MGQGVAIGQYAEVRVECASLAVFRLMRCCASTTGRRHLLYNNQQVERCFSKQDVQVFGDLAHDNNILHSSVNWKEALTEMPHLEAIKDSGLIRMEEEKNATKSMTKPLVHGILVSSLFSSIFGTLSPGCVYMNQTLQFANPVFVDDLVLARLEIEKIRNWRRGGLVVQCNTTVSVASTETPRIFDKKAVTGMANVWLPSGHQ